MASGNRQTLPVSFKRSGKRNKNILRIGTEIKMSKIYLIRHGLTEANEKHLYCGSTDLPLSQKGREELAEIKYDIDKSKVCFITSGMKRTEETLKILFGDIPRVIDSRFKEIDFGIFEMKSYNELKDTAEYQQWLDGDNHANIPPYGESGAQMEKRVLVAFAEIKGTDKDTVIITHGGVIASIMANLFKEENKNRYQWQPQPGHGYLIENDKYYIL